MQEMTTAEMSKLIARDLMGWVIHHRNTAHYMRAGDDVCDYKVQANYDWSCITPDAMVKILDRLDELGYDYEVYNTASVPAYRHACSIIDHDGHEYPVREAGTPPLAVARAVCEMLREAKPHA
jgi:hypothetical protein